MRCWPGFLSLPKHAGDSIPLNAEMVAPSQGDRRDPVHQVVRRVDLRHDHRSLIAVNSRNRRRHESSWVESLFDFVISMDVPMEVISDRAYGADRLE